jgi:hypothetical protein
VALPAQDAAAGETEQGRLASQLFADDFMGLAESPTALQQGITAARDWCNKWRMQANVGPAKTALMVVAPEHGPPLAEGSLMWGTEAMPVMQQYKYLGSVQVLVACCCTQTARGKHMSTTCVTKPGGLRMH